MAKHTPQIQTDTTLNQQTQKQSVKRTNASRQPTKKQIPVVDNKPQSTLETVVRKPHPIIYTSIKIFVEAVCHSEHQFHFYTKDEIEQTMEPLFRNNVMKENFWANLIPITETNSDVRETKPENIRYSFLLNAGPTNESVELYLYRHHLDDDIIKLMDREFLAKAKSKGKNYNVAMNSISGITTLSHILLNISMFQGKMQVGFRGSFDKMNEKSEQVSQFGGVDGSFHQVKIDVAESLHGMKDHMVSHNVASTKISEDAERCENKIGYHPAKGWCVLNNDGTVTPLVDLLGNITTSPSELVNRELLFCDLEALVKTIEFMNIMVEHSRTRHMSSGLMSFKNKNGNPPFYGKPFPLTGSGKITS